MGGAAKGLLLALGIVALAAGLLWIGQGTGYVPWPASSTMINHIRWAYSGAALAICGLIAIVISRRA
jgi:hypothetical protein